MDFNQSHSESPQYHQILEHACNPWRLWQLHSLMSSQVMGRDVGIKQLLASGTWRIGYLGAEVVLWTYQNNEGDH